MIQEKTFEQFLVDRRVVGYHDSPVTFKSGIRSHWYVNCRVLAQRLSYMEDAAEYVVDFLKAKKLLKGVDAVIGIPEGATELGNAVSRQCIKEGLFHNDALYLLRVKQKTHGDPANREWTNGNVPKKVILLEDVTSTGGSALEIVERLRENGVAVVAVVGLVNRLHALNGVTVLDAFKKKKCSYYSLTTAKELLVPFLNQFSGKKRKMIEEKIMSDYRA